MTILLRPTDSVDRIEAEYYEDTSAVCVTQVAVIQAEVSLKQQDCETDLAKAEPALEAATAALDTLNKVLSPAPRRKPASPTPA